MVTGALQVCSSSAFSFQGVVVNERVFLRVGSSCLSRGTLQLTTQSAPVVIRGGKSAFGKNNNSKTKHCHRRHARRRSRVTFNTFSRSFPHVVSPSALVQPLVRRWTAFVKVSVRTTPVSCVNAGVFPFLSILARYETRIAPSVIRSKSLLRAFFDT